MFKIFLPLLCGTLLLLTWSLSGAKVGSSKWTPKTLLVPDSFSLSPIINEIDGRVSESAIFESPKGVKESAKAVVDLWESRGLHAVGVARSDRAAAFAIEKSSGKRFSLAAWRDKSGNTTGILGSIESFPGKGPKSSIPGVPIPAGSEVGGTIRTTEFGNEGFVSTLTVYLSKRNLLHWYERNLRGWKKMSESRYIKDEKELTILVAESPVLGDERGVKSLATLIMRDTE